MVNIDDPSLCLKQTHRQLVTFCHRLLFTILLSAAGILFADNAELQSGSDSMNTNQSHEDQAARLTDACPKPATPPDGAIVLFDGTSLEQFAMQQHGGDWLQPVGPATVWEITPEGFLTVVPETGSLISRHWFGDMYLHVEFRVLYPDTNGGIYLMCRYELDINDSYGEEEPSLGAFSNLANRIPPLVNTSRPIGEWQTMDVSFRAPRLASTGELLSEAKATVWIDGIKIQDAVVLGPRKGAAKRLGDAEKGPLMLQEHGTPYQFRNIWIIEQ